MVYDAVGMKSSLPQEKEEDARGQQKLTERDKEVVRLPTFFFPRGEGVDFLHTGEMEVDCETRCGTDLGRRLYVPQGPAWLKDNMVDAFDQSFGGPT